MNFHSMNRSLLSSFALALCLPHTGFAEPQINTNDASQKAKTHLFKRYPHLKARDNTPTINTTISHAKTNRLGLTVVTFNQSYAGIPVYQKKASVLVAANGKVSSTHSDLADNTPAAMFADAPELMLQAQEAVKLAFAELGYQVSVSQGRSPLSVTVASANKQLLFESRDVILDQVWFEQLGELLPAFTFTLAFEDTLTHEHVDHGFIVASEKVGENPRILEHGSQHSHASHEYTIFGGETGDLLTTNSYGASPRFYPLIGRIDVKVDPFPYSPPSIHSRSFSTISTSDPWLSPQRGASFGTSGNHLNVCIETPFGQAPATAENCGREGWESVPYSSDLAFNWQYDPNKPLSHESRRASAVNIFYLYNQLHDFFYDFGFDENAGNAQRDNYGRGGEQGDQLNVFVMESSKFNNASAQTLSDGNSPTILMHPYLRQPRLSSKQFGITLKGTVNEGLPNESRVNEKLDGVAYSYLGQQVFEDVTAEVFPLAMTEEDGCNPLLSTEGVKGKIALYPIETCELNDDNTVIQENMALLKEAGAVGIVFGVSGQEISQYQQKVPFSTRFENPLPHMFLSFDEIFYQLFFDPFLCDDEGETCAPYTLTLNSIDAPIVRDSAIGHAISIHEWVHYLTSRSVGISFRSGTQYRALLEGWADFIAVFFMMQQQDRDIAGNENWQGIYSFSDWSISRALTGIRRVPYTTDFTRNALTVENIGPDAPVSAGALGHTVLSKSSPNNEPHNAGEIWATVLLEAYVALLNDTSRLTFEQAQTRMISYVFTSMQMLGTSISFADARNMFLSAAYAHDPKDYHVLKRAFARRGMGVNFTAPKSFSTTFSPVENSFDVDFRALAISNADFLASTNIEQIKQVQADFDDKGGIDLSLFESQVRAALPSCANMDDVRYGLMLVGYESKGDLDVKPFDIAFTETTDSHILFGKNGKINVDGLRYDENANTIMPFAYLASADNIAANVSVSVDAKQGESTPDTVVFDLLLNPSDDASEATQSVDCQLGRDIPSVSEVGAATVTSTGTDFTFSGGKGREEQSVTITVTNTSNERQKFTVINQISSDVDGIEMRYPRALHVPANTSRTFALRAVNRAKQLQPGRSTVEGVIQLKSDLSTLVIPYSVVSVKSLDAAR